MPWLKRNLYFLVGSIVALALIGLAGFFLYTKWQLDSANLAKLNTYYEELGKKNAEKPHPGNSKIDNIKAASLQTTQVVAMLEQARKHFERIPPIPDMSQLAEPGATNVPKLTDMAFATNFSRTINQLQREATNASIVLPNDYSFSFQNQARKLSFTPGSLDLLAVQLGEVRAICDVLFAAKINAIDSIRREAASPDDRAGSSTGDYLGELSQTNPAYKVVISPYELTFRCFSQELGAVIAGFAKSPYAMIVKAINVEGLVPGAPGLEVLPTVATTAVAPAPGLPAPTTTQAIDEARQRAITRMNFEKRYGAAMNRNRYGPGGSGGPGGYGPGGRPGAPPPPPPSSTVGIIGLNPATAPPPGAPGKSGPNVVLDEKQLKVTMMLGIVKLDSKPASAK